VPDFFKVTKKVTAPRGGLKRALTRRVKAAGTIATRAVAEGLKDAVIDRIPRGEAWLELYRDAITYLENAEGTQLSVAGLSETKLTTVPAESTQIKIIGTSIAALILAQHNPWTVDTLPAVSGGLPAESEVRPASESEMVAHRERLRPVLVDVLNKLARAGVTVLPGEFPTIGGKVFMDLRFLQLRLEHGLGGFPRTPHWLPAAREAKNKATKWVNVDRAEIADALEGKPIAAGDLMNKALEGRLKRKRKKTWL